MHSASRVATQWLSNQQALRQKVFTDRIDITEDADSRICNNPFFPSRDVLWNFGYENLILKVGHDCTTFRFPSGRPRFPTRP